MKRPGLCALLLTLAASGPACGAQRQPVAGSDSATAVKVSLQSLASDPQRYVGTTVQVSGTLDNAGSNFFTDLRVRLRDDEGHSIAVRPWLPTAVLPGPKRPGVTPPPTLSKYLGKQVDLTAVVEHGELPRTAEGFYLDVQSAEIVE